MTTYVPLNRDQIVGAQRLFRTVVVPVMTEEHADEDGRAGAIFDLRDSLDNLLLFIAAGTAPADKFDDYRVNARAKNDALAQHPEFNLSWEVHGGDLREPPYPGAIRTPEDDRFSISGFSWQRDTVGSLWLANKLGRITEGQALARADICGIRLGFNRLFKKMNAATKLPAEA